MIILGAFSVKTKENGRYDKDKHQPLFYIEYS